MSDLEKLRSEINEIDETLMELINSRARVAKQIGEIKKKNKMGVLQVKRERVVIKKVRALATDISPTGAEMIWKEIMSACREVQGEYNKVAYLGPEGTFTQQAALAFFPKTNTDFIPVGRKHEIFDQVEKGMANYGIIPVENTLQGSVSETLDLLIERNLKIYGEIELRIVHNLVGLKKAKFSELKTLYSHPLALLQVNGWIKKNIPQVDLIEASSTAGAIKKLAEMKDPTAAAIGTELAAKKYKLQALAKGIEDSTANFTRFLIISKSSPPVSGEDKTSMVFVTKHTPGSLFNVIKVFAEADVNLAKIESRPRKANSSSLWEYIFILDFDDHVNNVPEVLEQVNENAIWMKILGSYPRKPKKSDT